MSKQKSTTDSDDEVSRKTGDFSYYAESYRNRIRSYRYKFTRDDAWRKKLHNLIFDNLMSVLVSLDKDWPLYVWTLRLRMMFCLRDQSNITTMKSFETFPVPSNYPTLLDGPFQNAYDSLAAQIEGYECESKSVIVRALHLEFLADQEMDKEDSDDEDTYYTHVHYVQSCTIV